MCLLIFDGANLAATTNKTDTTTNSSGSKASKFFHLAVELKRFEVFNSIQYDSIFIKEVFDSIQIDSIFTSFFLSIRFMKNFW